MPVSGPREHRHRPADLAVHRLLLSGPGASRVRGRRRGGLLPGEAAVGPDHFRGGEIQDGQPAPLLRVARSQPARDGLSVGGLGDVGRDVGGLRPLGGIHDEHEDVASLRVECKVLNGLPVLQLEGRQALFLLSLVVSLLSRRLVSRVADQLLFLFLQEFLAFGRLGIARPRVIVRELFEGSGRERHQEQVVVTREGDGGLVAGPAGIGLGRSGSRNLLPGMANRVDKDDVAAVDEKDATPRLVPGTRGRRRYPAVFVAELARYAAVPAHDVGRRFLLAGPTPVEVQLL